MSHQQPAQTTNSNVSTRKKRRGMIEKRRRDKINNSLCELRRLVPAAFEKQGSSKLEKAEILQMTVDYLRMLHARGLAGTPGSPIMTPTFTQTSTNSSLPSGNSLTPVTLTKMEQANDGASGGGAGGPNSSSSDHSPPLSVTNNNNNNSNSSNLNSSHLTGQLAFNPSDIQHHAHNAHHNYYHHLSHHHQQHLHAHHHHHQVTGAATTTGEQVQLYPPNHYPQYYV